jgi:hypothetical protein
MSPNNYLLPNFVPYWRGWPRLGILWILVYNAMPGDTAARACYVWDKETSNKRFTMLLFILHNWFAQLCSTNSFAIVPHDESLCTWRATDEAFLRYYVWKIWLYYFCIVGHVWQGITKLLQTIPLCTLCMSCNCTPTTYYQMAMPCSFQKVISWYDDDIYISTMHSCWYIISCKVVFSITHG